MSICHARKPELVAKGHVNLRTRTDMVRFNGYLDPALFARVRKLAQDDGMSLSATLRGLIVDGLGKRMREAA